jgi:hypothetical protein
MSVPHDSNLRLLFKLVVHSKETELVDRVTNSFGSMLNEEESVFI